MNLNQTLRDVSNDARGWLNPWARDFTEAEAGATHAQLLSLLDQASDSGLDRPPREANPFFKSLGQAIYGAALHESYHVGEIGALRKALGKPRIG